MANKTIDIDGIVYPFINSRVGWFSKKLNAAFTGRVTKITIRAHGVSISVRRDKNPNIKRQEREYVRDPLTKKYHFVTVEKLGLDSATVNFTTPKSMYFV